MLFFHLDLIDNFSFLVDCIPVILAVSEVGIVKQCFQDHLILNFNDHAEARYGFHIAETLFLANFIIHYLFLRYDQTKVKSFGVKECFLTRF